MDDLLDAALTFPAVLFSFSLIVVVGYWLLVLVGGADVDSLDGDAGGDFDDASGAGGVLASVGLHGVPVTVVLSLLVLVAWFLSLVGVVLTEPLEFASPLRAVVLIAVLGVALVGAVLVTRLLVSPLRRLFADEPAASRIDFVGLSCVIRTGSVTIDFGQAEVTSPDGSSAIIQVRQAGDDHLTAGVTAVIYDYDPAGEFFWVHPIETTPDTDPLR